MTEHSPTHPPMTSPASALSRLHHQPTLEDGAIPLSASLRRAFKNVEQLCAHLGLEPSQAPYPLSKPAPFSMLVTQEFAARMERGNWHDPLLRQVLPLAREYSGDGPPGSPACRDAVGDAPATITPGLIHKYQGRALIIAHGACAIHCRYCFRRHFPYTTDNASEANWQRILKALAADTSISEIILSGGDPLMSPDSTLAAQLSDLAAIPHITTARIHTRLPVVCPARIGPALLNTLAATPLRIVMVLHINHAQEIDDELRRTSHKLAQCTWLLNQSVLLAGVNDKAEPLIALSRALFDSGIAPYYLHMLDEIDGVSHFRVPERRARALHHQMQQALPGYLVPKLVREIAGEPSKRWMNRH